MSDLQKEIDAAYGLVATIPVSGDHVDVIAAAREHLRHAYKLAGLEIKEAKPDGGQNDR